MMEIAIGAIGIAIALLAIVLSKRQVDFARRSYELQLEDVKQKLEQAVGDERLVQVYLTREATVKAMLKNYDEAAPGDVIWTQCVGCGNYSVDTKSIVLGSASRGVAFKLILNAHAPTIREMRQLYAPLKNADLVEGTDNAIRIQGVSDKVVILALRSIDSYTGIKIRDPHLVKLFRDWFDQRFATLKAQD